MRTYVTVVAPVLMAVSVIKIGHRQRLGVFEATSKSVAVILHATLANWFDDQGPIKPSFRTGVL